MKIDAQCKVFYFENYFNKYNMDVMCIKALVWGFYPQSFLLF